jgi:transposase-like protein
LEKPRSPLTPSQDPGMSRTRHTDEEKARIVREFENHEGTTVDYCRQRGISCQTFTNWRRRAEASLASKVSG